MFPLNEPLLTNDPDNRDREVDVDVRATPDEGSGSSDCSVAGLPPVLPTLTLIDNDETDWLMNLCGSRHPDRESYIDLSDHDAWILHDYIMSIILHFSPKLAEWNTRPSDVEYLKERISRRADERNQSRSPALQLDAFDWFLQSQGSDIPERHSPTERADHNQPEQSSAP